MHAKPTICAIILNWNKKDWLESLLYSLLESAHYPPPHFVQVLDIVVVDNASTDQSVDLIKQKFPFVKIIENSFNLGGSGGYNTGLKYALKQEYDFVWLLDNDVKVMPGALDGLLEAMESDPHIGLVGSKILHYDNEQLISEVGALINHFTIYPIPQLADKIDDHKTLVLDVDYVAACSVLARIKHVRTVGILDDKYFLMWDDMEWGVRFRKAGLRVVATTKSAVVHPGFSERNINPSFVYYASRNHLYFAAKIYSGIRRVFHLSYLHGVLHSHALCAKLNPWTVPYFFSIDKGVQDFWCLKMGKNQHNFPSTTPLRGNTHLTALPKGAFMIILSTNRPVSVLKNVIRKIQESYEEIEIILITNDKRVNLLNWYDKDKIWIKGTGLFDDIVFCWKIYCNANAVARFWDDTDTILYNSAQHCWIIDDQGEVLQISSSRPITATMKLIKRKFTTRIAFVTGFTKGVYLALTRNTLSRIDSMVRDHDAQ